MTPRIARGPALVAAAVLGLGAAASAGAAPAQAVRVTGTASVRYVELRTLVSDSLPARDIEGEGLLRRTSDGRVVRCVPGDAFCRGTRPGEVVSTLPVVQDLEVSAWGFGEGVRFFGHVRGRAVWSGSRELWPRAAEPLDVLAAYAELDRARLRVRLGRQWTVSGLGFYNFDGLSLAMQPSAGLSVEGYAGRSLVRGLNEPRTGGALEAIEPLAPDRPGVLVGAQARYRPSTRFAGSVLYQVDVRDDRRGLHSELIAANAQLRGARGSLEAALELDAATAAVNEARFRVRPEPIHGIAVHAEGRRYRPYFELWTIWGAFSPVGFDEASVGFSWLPGGRWLVRGDAAYRRYEDAGSGGAGRFSGDGWSAGARVGWTPSAPWRLDAGYRAAAGFGAARHDGHLGVARQLGESGSLALQAVAFQRLYEFRLDEGTVVGLGGEGALRVSGRTRLSAGIAGYRHVAGGPTPALDWNQLRASLRLQWTLGPEPGAGVQREVSR